MAVGEEAAVAVDHVHLAATGMEMGDVYRKPRTVVAAEEAVFDRDPADGKIRTGRLDVHSALGERPFGFGEDAVTDRDVAAVDYARPLPGVPLAEEILQNDIAGLQEVDSVAARFLQDKIPDLHIVDRMQREQMPPLGMAIALGIEIVAAVHGEPRVAFAAQDDIRDILQAEKAIGGLDHRAGLGADRNAVCEHDLHVRRHLDRFDQPFGRLLVDNDLLRARIERRLKAFRGVGGIPTE